MADFVSLATLLRAEVPVSIDLPLVVAEPIVVCDSDPSPIAVDECVRSARRFHASLADALDARLDDLLRDLASEVLGRELAITPAEIATLIRRLIDERRADDPVRVHVAPEDAAIACGLPLVVDPMLRSGDAVLVCAYGSIDARLGVRLADVLERGRA